MICDLNIDISRLQSPEDLLTMANTTTSLPDTLLNTTTTVIANITNTLANDVINDVTTNATNVQNIDNSSNNNNNNTFITGANLTTGECLYDLNMSYDSLCEWFGVHGSL